MFRINYKPVFPSKEVFDPELALQKFHRAGNGKQVIKEEDKDDENDQQIKRTSQQKRNSFLPKQAIS